MLIWYCLIMKNKISLSLSIYRLYNIVLIFLLEWIVGMNFWGNHYSGMISVIKRSIVKTVYPHAWRSSWSFLLGSFTISFWAINRLVSSQRMILAIRSTGGIYNLSMIFSFIIMWFEQTIFFLYQMSPLPLSFMVRRTCYYLWWTSLSFWWLNIYDEFFKLREGSW